MRTEPLPRSAELALPATRPRRLALARRVRGATLAQYLALAVLLFLTFFILLLMVALSLRPTVLIYIDFWALPWPPTFDNYQGAFVDLIPSTFRTLYVTAASILGILAISCVAA